jgi:hypothetical protein
MLAFGTALVLCKLILIVLPLTNSEEELTGIILNATFSMCFIYTFFYKFELGYLATGLKLQEIFAMLAKLTLTSRLMNG